MQLDIVTTTDGRYIGQRIDTQSPQIALGNDRVFVPDRIWCIGDRLWRLANSNYVIDATEA